MTAFDYGAEAELYPGVARPSRRRPVSYRRFARAAEAIRFAIEELPPESLVGAALEVGDERFDSRGMRQLYDSPDYPLARRKPTGPASAQPQRPLPGRSGASATANGRRKTGR
jgi:hypothetical protein